jgi:zinc transporter 1/2/3
MGGLSEQQAWGKIDATPNDSPQLHAAHSLRNSMDGESDLDIDIDELDPQADRDADNDDLLVGRALPRHSYTRTRSPNNDPSLPNAEQSNALTGAALEQKLLLQCLLLEAGILFHSIFIGMALSVSTGPPFAVLLLAISFHQTFEGLALGSRIAAIPSLSPTSPKPWLMAIAYGTTTPIGQAIGLAVQGFYDPRSETGLLMVGFMNAISSGLLLFAGMVELLAEDFLSDRSYAELKGKRRREACISVVCGALLMAAVGAWA